jgi:hypothetical protein
MRTSKNGLQRRKSSKKIGTLTIEKAMNRPDRTFLSPEMVMQDINSYVSKANPKC